MEESTRRQKHKRKTGVDRNRKHSRHNREGMKDGSEAKEKVRDEIKGSLPPKNRNKWQGRENVDEMGKRGAWSWDQGGTRVVGVLRAMEARRVEKQETGEQA